MRESREAGMDDPEKGIAWLKKEIEYQRAVKENMFNISREQSNDNDALRAVLKKHEWCAGHEENISGYCPECDNWNTYGHAPGCEIDRLLNGDKK